jgi:hypothetical protein
VLEAIESPELAAFVAWVPILASDHLPDDPTRALVFDPRARHFWDEGGLLSPLFKQALGLPRKVKGWDLYLAYGRGAVWSGEPPPPSFWQHQLGPDVEPFAPKLEGVAFAKGIRRLLGDGL